MLLKAIPPLVGKAFVPRNRRGRRPRRPASAMMGRCFRPPLVRGGVGTSRRRGSYLSRFSCFDGSRSGGRAMPVPTGCWQGRGAAVGDADPGVPLRRRAGEHGTRPGPR